MPGVTGPRDQLRALAGKLLNLPAERERLHQQLGGAAIKLVADGFRSESDPYGVAWSPLLHREGLILRDSGRMAQSVYFETTPTGIRLVFPVIYAATHHYGRPDFGIPSRKLGPSEDLGMPPRWGDTFNRTAVDWFIAYFR
jgi:phage gpG-like protein